MQARFGRNVVSICPLGLYASHRQNLLATAELAEVRRREEEAGITPEPALDRFMEAVSLQARASDRSSNSSHSWCMSVTRIAHGGCPR